MRERSYIESACDCPKSKPNFNELTSTCNNYTEVNTRVEIEVTPTTVNAKTSHSVCSQKNKEQECHFSSSISVVMQATPNRALLIPRSLLEVVARSRDKSVFHGYFRSFLDYVRISPEQAVPWIFCAQCTHVHCM